ncbi:MAG: Ribosomal large subunit methyltransferase [Chloroflexota bacterium]
MTTDERTTAHPGDGPTTPLGAADDVELLDCGDGRRLERFGSVLLDRPAPAVADLPRRDPAAWRAADARYDRGPGWTGPRPPTGTWRVRLGGVGLTCRLSAEGGVGCYPEHAALWRAIADELASRPGARLLNGFGHTGGLTIAAAAAGASVAHVDAARAAVGTARSNAEADGLAGAPIRWIVDDVRAFVEREVRRGRRYDLVVLDPPSYGQGGGGRAWRLADDLPRLAASAIQLLEGPDGALVVTLHSSGWTEDRLRRLLDDTAPVGTGGRPGGTTATWTTTLAARSGALLPAGIGARWEVAR